MAQCQGYRGIGEAHRFTLWLEANIDALSERIGLQLNVLEREKAVGAFSVDLLCGMPEAIV